MEFVFRLNSNFQLPYEYNVKRSINDVNGQIKK